VRVDLLVPDVGLPGGMNGRQLADGARVLVVSSRCCSSRGMPRTP
jgi:hypothetical protein